MFMSLCIFARMVCASTLSFLDRKICALQEPSIIIINAIFFFSISDHSPLCILWNSISDVFEKQSQEKQLLLGLFCADMPHCTSATFSSVLSVTTRVSFPASCYVVRND